MIKLTNFQVYEMLYLIKNYLSMSISLTLFLRLLDPWVRSSKTFKVSVTKIEEDEIICFDEYFVLIQVT